MFFTKRKIFFFTLLFSCVLTNAQLKNPSQECKTTAEVDVFIDTFHGEIEYGHAIITCDSCFYLRAVDSTYEIVGFKTKAELSTGKINEASAGGKYFAIYPYAEMNLLFAKKGTPIYFYCIMAKSNGETYYLKAFFITKKEESF